MRRPAADDPESEKATELVMARFEKLLDVLLASNAPTSRIMTALALTPYVIDKCRPDRTLGHKTRPQGGRRGRAERLRADPP